MSSSYKVKKLRKAKNKRRRKIKLPLKLVDPKYRVAFHEVAHAVLIKHLFPNNRVYLSINNHDDKWTGTTTEPDCIGQSREWKPHALVSIAGIIAETYYMSNPLKSSYRKLTTEVELCNDYQNFGKSYLNYKKYIARNSEEQELLQFDFFERNYFEVIDAFRQFGIVKMHFLAKKLMRDLCIDDGQTWIR